MKFAYTILYVPDVTRSLAFYEAAFGLQRRFLYESGMYAELDTGVTTLAFVNTDLAKASLPDGVQPSDPARPPAAFEIAFSTADVPAAYEHAVSVGAAAVAAPKTKPWGQTVAYVRDLDGNLVEICTPMA